MFSIFEMSLEHEWFYNELIVEPDFSSIWLYWLHFLDSIAQINEAAKN